MKLYMYTCPHRPQSEIRQAWQARNKAGGGAHATPVLRPCKGRWGGAPGGLQGCRPLQILACYVTKFEPQKVLKSIA